MTVGEKILGTRNPFVWRQKAREHIRDTVRSGGPKPPPTSTMFTRMRSDPMPIIAAIPSRIASALVAAAPRNGRPTYQASTTRGSIGLAATRGLSRVMRVTWAATAISSSFKRRLAAILAHHFGRRDNRADDVSIAGAATQHRRDCLANFWLGRTRIET